MQGASTGLEISAGGILFDSGSKVSIVDSNVTEVDGGMVGGIFGSAGGSLEISGSYFERATASMAGAFIAGSGGTILTMRDSVLRDIGRHDQWAFSNFALFDGPTSTISRCRFEASPIGWFYVTKVTVAPRSLWDLRMTLGLALTLCPPPCQSLQWPSTIRTLSCRAIWTLGPWRSSRRVPPSA